MVKRTYWITAGVALVVVAAVFALASSVSGIPPLEIPRSGQHIPEKIDFIYEGSNVEIAFQQQSAMIYKYKSKNLTEKDALQIFRNIGGVTPDSDLVIVSEGSLSLPS